MMKFSSQVRLRILLFGSVALSMQQSADIKAMNNKNWPLHEIAEQKLLATRSDKEKSKFQELLQDSLLNDRQMNIVSMFQLFPYMSTDIISTDGISDNLVAHEKFPKKQATALSSVINDWLCQGSWSYKIGLACMIYNLYTNKYPELLKDRKVVGVDDKSCINQWLWSLEKTIPDYSSLTSKITSDDLQHLGEQ